jgi:hypothetical protein
MEVLKEAPLMAPLDEKSRAALSQSTCSRLLAMRTAGHVTEGLESYLGHSSLSVFDVDECCGKTRLFRVLHVAVRARHVRL